MNVPFWIVILWAVIATFIAFLFWLKIYKGVPFPDTGFFIFRTADARAHRILDEILIRHGFRAVKTINSGGICRSVFSNGLVICHIDPDAPDAPELYRLPTAAIAIPVARPLVDAGVAGTKLTQEAGFMTSQVKIDPTVPMGTMMGLVPDRSFPARRPFEWGLIFRLSVLEMMRQAPGDVRPYQPVKA